MGKIKDSTIPADGPDVTHDPLCSMSADSDGRDFEWCMCPLIAKVRADERQKTFDADWSEMGQLAAVRLFCRQAERKMLAKCLAVVENAGQIIAIVDHGQGPKKYAIEEGCGECHGEQFGADAALELVLAALRTLSSNYPALDATSEEAQ